MKKSRGLSLDEKRKRAAEFFFEKRDFFQLRELEKMLPKEKGIVAQSVKEVVQSLVDDRLVNLEKIGSSNYFWSFPSTALQSVSGAPVRSVPLTLQRKAKMEEMRVELARLKQLQDGFESQISSAVAGREDTVSPPRRPPSLRLARAAGDVAAAERARVQAHVLPGGARRLQGDGSRSFRGEEYGPLHSPCPSW